MQNMSVFDRRFRSIRPQEVPELACLLERIKATYAPVAIFLYGSRARGDAGPSATGTLRSSFPIQRPRISYPRCWASRSRRAPACSPTCPAPISRSSRPTSRSSTPRPTRCSRTAACGSISIEVPGPWSHVAVQPVPPPWRHRPPDAQKLSKGTRSVTIADEKPLRLIVSRAARAPLICSSTVPDVVQVGGFAVVISNGWPSRQ